MRQTEMLPIGPPARLRWRYTYDYSLSWAGAENLLNQLYVCNPGGSPKAYWSPGTSASRPTSLGSVGDVIFYDWGLGEGVSHVSIQVAYGTDALGWTGDRRRRTHQPPQARLLEPAGLQRELRDHMGVRRAHRSDELGGLGMIRQAITGRRVLAGAGAVTALLLAGALWGGSASASAPVTGPDADAIRGVVTRALHLVQEESLPPSTYNGGPMSDDLRAKMSAKAMADAEQLFSGAGLTWFEGVVKYNLDEQASGYIRHIGGGVSRIAFTSISITGDQASVAVTEDVWADIAQVQDSGKTAVAHPKNTMLASLLLQRVDGKWYVTDYRASFAPGSEP